MKRCDSKLFITTMAGHAWGGSEELWVLMAQKSKEKGEEVSAVIFNWGRLPKKVKQIEKGGVTIHRRKRFQYRDLIKKPWGKFVEKTFALKELENVVKKCQPNKIIMSMGGFCDLEVDVNRDFLISTTVPYDLIVHANPDNYYPAYKKVQSIIKACKKAKTVFFVSKRLKEIAIRQTGYSFPNGKIIVNPVNMEKIGILPWPDTKILNFACVGRLDAKVKGQALLLQALASPEWKERNWHLNLYGKGPDEDYFIHLVKSFELEDKVSFKGYVQDIRNDIWKNNHLLVMPSYFEGLPIALVEAMLCGRPAVVTDVGGNREILRDNISGFVAKGVNYNSFNNALNLAWQNRASLEEIGQKAFLQAKKYTEKEVL